MNNALIVRNVSKTFDKFKLDKISFEVPGGSIVGVNRKETAVASQHFFLFLWG